MCLINLVRSITIMRFSFLPICIVLINTSSLSAQTKKNLRWGDLSETRISVQNFQEQSEITINKDYVIDSALILFNIPGSKGIEQVTFFPIFDSIRFKRATELLIPGSTINLYCKYRDKASYRTDTAWKIYVIRSYKTEIVGYTKTASQQELERITSLNLIKGTIHFLGANFPSVIKINLSEKNIERLQKMFARCGPGTILNFENVIATDEQGKREHFTQILKLQ